MSIVYILRYCIYTIYKDTMNVNISFNWILQFLSGGLVVVIVSYLASYMDPLLASLFWSYPLSLLPSLYYMKQNGTNNIAISKFLLGISFLLPLLILMLLVMSFCFRRSNNSTILQPIIYSTLIWLVSSILFYLVIKNSFLYCYFI